MKLRIALMLAVGGMVTVFAESVALQSMGAESGQAALFVVDASPEFAAMGGECVKFGNDSTPGASRRLLAIAKGPTRSTVVVVAFEASSDRLLEKLSPIAAEQTVDSTAVRFPREERGELWLFDKPDMRADLFIVVGQQDDARLALIRKDIDAVQAATNADTRLEHSASLRNRLTGLMRNQSPGTTGRSIPSTLAAVRRGLSTLKDQWKDDSDPIAFEKDQPGIKLIKIGSAVEKTSSIQSDDKRQVDSGPHPWLNDVPGGLSRLVNLGKVRIEVDEAMVQAAKRTALTAFQFKFAYRMRYRSPAPNPSSRDGETIKLLVRFTEFDWDVEHRIMLSDKFLPTKPWETPLLRHEFDHVAVSTDPRLLAMMESLNRAEVAIPMTLDQGRELSSKRFDDEVHAYVKRFQKSLEDLVNDRYRKLDDASNNGLQAITDRSAFFRKLYLPEELESANYEYLKLVLSAIKKVDSAQIDRHYGFR